MRKTIAVLTMVTAALMAAPNPSHAGPFTDDLSRCLVRATTETERVDLVRWIVAAITVHPGVKNMAGISDERRNAETKRAAGLFADLLTVRCREESLDAFKFEGEVAFSAAFEVLGQVAMQTLVSDPAVAAEMTKLGDHLDDNQLKPLFEGR